MGTIISRKRGNGSMGHTAQIVIKRGGKIVHREAKTFDRRQAAATWLDKREAELKRPGGVEAAKRPIPTLGQTIDRYTSDSLKQIGRTKAQVLRSLKAYPIADKASDEITSADIIELAQQLSAKMKPQTVQNYLSHLSAVFGIAAPAWGIPLDPQAMQAAFSVAKRLGITSKSEKRDRRPTVAEVDQLMEFFTERAERSPEAAPMPRIIGFALFSTRRQGEIVRIEWSDYDHLGKRVLVKDMKHPGQKAGNDVWCDLPDEAIGFMGIDIGNPISGRIFPCSEEAISAAFTRACKLLGIKDLHFHDLRHEGISRLFEMGKTIPQAASVSGHRSWQSLQRYTHLRQTGDKWKDWKWLDRQT